MTAACEVCQGLGYLLGQSYERIDPSADSLPVQRCDACDRHDSDESAARAAAHDTRRRLTFMSALDGSGHELGDWVLGERQLPCATTEAYACPICGTCRPDGALPCLVCPS